MSALREPSAAAPAFPFDNSYARLPERFYARLAPTAVRAPRLIRVNAGLARLLGLDPDWLASPAGVAVLAGNAVPPGAASIATAYSGHQFGHFNPQLGDGRAILLGEVVGSDGVRRDIQLKGAGPTPWSRMGDGRAALGPVLREYIVSEAMHALGVPTTRALAAVLTGDGVVRERILPGAVLARVAQSHIRVGTFQYFAARQDAEGLRLLADHVIDRHYPEARATPNPYRALLDGVIARQAALIAQWLGLGFIHGVMNTDNMQVAGETIDYGPCAFMDEYHPATVFSSIDRQGRYAYANQPQIGGWNLARFAETLLPLLDADEDKAVEQAQAALDLYGPAFQDAWLGILRRKLGLGTAQPGDQALADALLKAMTDTGADFANTFRALAAAAAGDEGPARACFHDPAQWDAWAPQWRARLEQEGQTPAQIAAALRRANPAYMPRNHLVEAAIRAAEDHDDFTLFEDLLAVVTAPWDEQPGRERYVTPPQEHERVRQTFCGT